VNKVRSSWEKHEDEDEVVDDVVASYEGEIENPVMRQILRRDVRGVLGYLGTTGRRSAGR